MCSSTEVKIVLYSLWYHHTYRWPSRAQVERVLWLFTTKYLSKLENKVSVPNVITVIFIVSPCIFIYLLVFTNICTFIVIKILHKQSLM